MPRLEDLKKSYDSMTYEERLAAVQSMRAARVMPPKDLKPKKTKKQQTESTKLQKLMKSLPAEELKKLLADLGDDA